MFVLTAIFSQPFPLLQIGDTPDDVRAAVAAGSVPIGVLTPEEEAKTTLNGEIRRVGIVVESCIANQRLDVIRWYCNQ